MSVDYEVQLQKLSKELQEEIGVMLSPEQIAEDPEKHIDSLRQSLHNDISKEMFRSVLLTLCKYLEHKHQRSSLKLKELEEIYRSEKFKFILDTKEEFPELFERLEFEMKMGGREVDDKDRYVSVDFWDYVPLVLWSWGVFQLKRSVLFELSNPFVLSWCSCIAPKLKSIFTDFLLLNEDCVHDPLTED
jgi:hypothetical protein